MKLVQNFLYLITEHYSHDLIILRRLVDKAVRFTLTSCYLHVERSCVIRGMRSNNRALWLIFISFVLLR